MAEFSMWGPEQDGGRMAAMDQSKLLMEGLKSLHTAGEIQQQPIDARLKQAHARLYGAEADAKVQALEKDKAFTAALQGMSGGQAGQQPAGGTNQAGQLDKIGTLLLNAGMQKEAREYFNTASLVRSREDTAKMNQSRAQRFTQLIQKDKTERMGSLLHTVDGQESWDRALNTMQQEGIDVSTLGVTGDYAVDKPMVEQLRDASLKFRDVLEMGVKEGEAASRQELRQSRLQSDSARRTVMEAQRRLTEVRREKLEKAGGSVDGKPIGAPRAKEIDEANKILKDLGLSDAGERGRASYAIAARAKALAQQNPGLDMNEALNRALLEEQTAGNMPEAAWHEKGQIRYRPESSAAPKEAVKIQQAPPDPKSRKEGEVYQTPKGKFRWTKDGWVQVTGVSPMEQLAALGAMEDDDEEETI